jgi:hypothetical protein
MKTFGRVVLVASLLALGGCASIDYPDPAEWLGSVGELFGSKKKLPGERKAVFPEGVPGVAKGVPPDLMRGNQAAEVEPEPVQTQSIPKEEPKPKPKARPKPAPKVAAPAPPAEQSQPTRVTVRPSSPQASGGGQWPDSPAPQQAQPSGVQWPEPPGQQRPQAPNSGGVAWPDPPR